MKAHRFKTKLTTAEDVSKEFFGILNPRIEQRMIDVCKGKGILAFTEYKQSKDGIRMVAEEKLKLMKEWEQKGRNLAFLKDSADFNFMDLLEQKHFGRIVT